MLICENCEMTDEYYASGDCPNDTLTAKWKRGELPAEWYYIKFDTTDNIYKAFYAKRERHFNYCGTHIPENEITEVLAPVPSYDELKAIKEVLHIIKRQCELLMPKNGLNPRGDRAIMKMFLDKINEVFRDEI